MNSPSPDKIKKARKDAGLTQTAAAEKVYVNLRTWQRWEAGESKMPMATWQLFLQSA